MLETGGEAHRTAAAAMEGHMPAEETAPPPKTEAHLALEDAQLAMDAVALGAAADAMAGRATSWDEVRDVVAASYRDAGLEGMAAFVRRE